MTVIAEKTCGYQAYTFRVQSTENIIEDHNWELRVHRTGEGLK
jgi:hypothetical protein